VLADYAKQDTGILCHIHHLARGFHIGGRRFLDLDVFFGRGADLYGLQTEVRKSTQIHVIDFGMTADFFEGGYEFRTSLVRELLSVCLTDIGADSYFVSNVLVGVSVFI